MVPIVDGPRTPVRPVRCQCGGVREGPGRCPASTAFWRGLRVVEVHDPSCDLPAHVGIEAVSGQQRIRACPTLPRIGHACQGSSVAFEEALGGVAVRLGAVTTSRRSSRTTSIVARSMPFTRSSSRIARSPRGRARSRDSTQARANASSSRIPSSSSRSMAPSTRSAGSPRRGAGVGPRPPSAERASRKRAAASRTTWGSSTGARRSRCSASDSRRRAGAPSERLREHQDQHDRGRPELVHVGCSDGRIPPCGRELGSDPILRPPRRASPTRTLAPRNEDQWDEGRFERNRTSDDEQPVDAATCQRPEGVAALKPGRRDPEEQHEIRRDDDDPLEGTCRGRKEPHVAQLRRALGHAERRSSVRRGPP